MASPFTVRPWRPSDTAPLASWLSLSEPWRTLGYPADAWPAYFDSLGADPAREADIIGTDDIPSAGLAVVRRHVLLGDYLELLAIAPAARRRGLGHALLAYVEARAFGRTTNVYLCVSDFNAEGRAFYQSAGYLEVGHLDALVVSRHSEVLMRKTIGPARRA